MQHLTFMILLCLIVTTSLLMLAIEPPTNAVHRMMQGMDEYLIVDELHHFHISPQPSPIRADGDDDNNDDDVAQALRRVEWSSRYNVVHVITSRFMQHQSKLHHLAKARLELLKGITLPSLIQQTNQDFIWILRVDPKLDAETMNGLLQATKSMDNVVIHLTNANPEGYRLIPMDEYKPLANPESRPLLESYVLAAQTHTVLETRLDADDALMLSFVENLQKDASEKLERVTNKWMVWCLENHLEWQQNSPWQDHGSAIVGWNTPQCVTPGLTWGYPVGVVRDESVKAQHHKIHKRIPKCSDRDDAIIGNCLNRLEAAWPMALRARTITSAGMANLVLDHEKDPLALSLRDSQWKDRQDSLWDHLESLFGVTPRDLHRVRHELVEHMHEIAMDALKGQCTAGHSCKKRSKETLQQVVSETSSTTTV